MADERLIDWTEGLVIHCESLVKLRQTQERVSRGEYSNEFLPEWKPESKNDTKQTKDSNYGQTNKRKGRD